MTPIRLLLIQANPPDSKFLDLAVEQRNLQEALAQAAGELPFAVQVLPAGRVADLPIYLRRHTPHILHFAGHGDGYGGLRLNAHGDAKGEVLEAEELAAIVRAHQAEAPEPLRLAVLAACWTEEAARLLAQEVDCAVGFADDVDDDHLLRVFTPQVYGALKDGRSAPNAVDTACSVLRGQRMDSTAEIVRVFTRPGLPDRDLRPANWSAPVLSPAHLDYLRSWFAKPWADVSLADVLEGDGGAERRVPLLKIYVPLPVDFSLTLQVQDGRIIDWRAKLDERSELAKRAEELALLQVEGEAEQPKQPRLRAWPLLGVGEAELQPIVDEIQRKMEDRRRGAGKQIEDSGQTEQTEDDKQTDDGERSWYMEAHDAASVQAHFVLLGEPGSGKSSFLRHLALCLAGELRRRAGVANVPDKAGIDALRDWLLGAFTPIYAELRDLVRAIFPPLPAALDAPLRLPDTEDFWRYVQGFAGAQLAAPGGELRRLCDAGRAILLLDGLDEVPQADNPQRRQQVQALVAALVQSYPKLRVVVASRPQAWRRGGYALDGFGVAELRPLSVDRLSKLARQLFPAVLGQEGAIQADAFITALRTQLQDRRIERSFYANPLFFTLLAGLWLDAANGRRLPETRAELYRRSVNLLLRRWTLRRLPDPSVAEELGLNPAQLRSVLETLAVGIHQQSAPGQDTTVFHVKELLAVLFEAGCPVRVRDVPDYLSQHVGLLTSPEHGSFYFTHRSFQEHLAACELVCREPDKHLPPLAADRRFPNGIVARVLAKPDLWENVARLAADELAVTRRPLELGELLAACCAPYLAGKDGTAVRAALLALEIAREQKLFALPPDEREVRGREFDALRRTALAVLTDWERIEPEGRNLAGELLGARPEHDTRRGVGLRPDGLPDIDWVEIPEADATGQPEFIYQKGERRTEPTFWMARYPVTYLQFQAFVDAPDGYRDARWWEGLDAPDDVRAGPPDQRFAFWNHPRENVTWFAAVAFCRWLAWQAEERRDLLPSALRRRNDWRIRLPTEWQWEKAARGHDGRRYPWGGNEYRSGYANIDETYERNEKKQVGKYYLQKTSAAGMYPQDVSPYGICDLIGNVQEWCLNEHGRPKRIQEAGDKTRVLRGGSWYYSNVNAAAPVRRWSGPLNFNDYFVGFRVVVCFVPVSRL